MIFYTVFYLITKLEPLDIYTKKTEIKFIPTNRNLGE